MDKHDIAHFIKSNGFGLEGICSASNGGQFVLLRTKDTRYQTLIEAYDFSGDSPISVGFGTIYCTNGKERDPIRFLDLPERARKVSRWESLFIISDDYKDLGIGSALFDVIEKEMRQIGGLRVVSFWPEGEEKLMPKYIRLGYTRTEVTNIDNVPSKLQGNTNWMYKFY